MAITFDGATRRIALDTDATTASELWSRWVDWIAENPQWPVAMSQVGGDALGSGLSIPIYIFLENGWRVRPMEASHTLVITGNLFVQGGGSPVVQTLGTYNVSVQYTVPVQAQAVSTSGTPAPTADTVASAVWGHASGVDLLSKATLAAAILRNKTITDPTTGVMTVYADDGVTPLLTGQLYEDVGGSKQYRGSGADRRERLA